MLHSPMTRIVYWPFALPLSMVPDADAWLRGNLDGIAALDELETWLRLDDHARSDLDAAHLLFGGGGNTFGLLDQVIRAGHLDPIRRFVAGGGDYYGGSAGAVLACDDIAIAEGHDPNDALLGDLTALGLLHGVSILPHFSEAQLESAREWAKSRQRTLIGLPEAVGLRHDNGIFTVVGHRAVHVMDPTSIRSYPAGEVFLLE